MAPNDDVLNPPEPTKHYEEAVPKHPVVERRNKRTECMTTKSPKKQERKR